ncbi:MAG: LPS assembly lipoprotein LptE [Pseudomonadota bacterium]
MKAALIAIVLLLAGCGFQLQGRRVMPPVLATVHLEVIDEQSDFTRALRAALKASGSHLAEVSSADGATVRIKRDELTERVLSVNARNIPTDIELTYKVEVEVSAAGRELMALKPFELSRNFSFDERKYLAKEGEKDILRKDLARDMASVVTRTLSAL